MFAENPGVAKRFAAAIRTTDQWANRNLAESVPIVSKYTNVPAQIVATMNRVAFVPALVARLIQPVIDIAAISGTSGLTRPLLPLARRVKRTFEFSRSPSSATR